MIKIDNDIYELEIKDIKNLFNKRPIDSHKGMYGKIGILGGTLEYSGAIKLSNMSAVAVRSGTGIVRVIVPKKITSSISPYLLEQTLYPLKETNNNIDYEDIKEAIKDLKALAVGMGWGKTNDNQNILNYILYNYFGSLIIDADGLNILSKMNLDILNKTSSKVILTPHLKEFERLSGISMEEIKKDPIEISKNFAQKYNVILLLKGPTTIVTNGNITYLVKRGCPGMATAGSGDVLSGIIVGMLGYMAPSPLTIAASSYLAGLSGELAQNKYTDISMKASDTIEFIPDAIKIIRNS